MKQLILTVILVLIGIGSISAQPIIEISNKNEIIEVKDRCFYLRDAGQSLTLDEAINSEWLPLKTNVPNFIVSHAAYWIKLRVNNIGGLNDLRLEVSSPMLDEITLFYPDANGQYQSFESGEKMPFNQRKIKETHYQFPIFLEQQKETTLYLRVAAKEQIQLPIKIGSSAAISAAAKNRDMLAAIYLGIMLVMLFYNGFIYLTTKDKSYIYYVVYLLAVLLTQGSIQGYTFQYLWPNMPWLAEYSSFLWPPAVGIAGMQFMSVFLNTRSYFKKLDKLFSIYTILYLLAVAISMAGQYQIGFLMIEAVAVAVSLSMMVGAVKIGLSGYRPAWFFVAAWSAFLIGVTIYISKDFYLIPYSSFSFYMMPIGSAIEVILLSFALADRIRILKKEKEESQEKALEALKENERIILGQNQLLEIKVEERTHELSQANLDLEKAYKNLKDAQSQLVEAEKMASLGQLTAGIAHEINNPINFVSANVEPLKMDISDVLEILDTTHQKLKNTGDEEAIKEVESLRRKLDLDFLKLEIFQLVNGIKEGALRTAEIVKGLKTFSRLDESDLKTADLNEGLQSTIVILRNSMPDNLLVETSYGEIPPVECFPGKINQVFMNILSNAIQAIKMKPYAEKQSLKVITRQVDERVYIHIIDSGPGMTDEVKARIFEPFFTTKEVGEGTGLGLSISFRIIETHSGTIHVNTELGKGTEFILSLPIQAQIKSEE